MTLDEPGDTAPGRGKYAKYMPYAFTEQGVAMLSRELMVPPAAPKRGIGFVRDP